MRVLITGSRTWKDEDAIKRVMESHAGDVFVFGDCPTGADAIAYGIALMRGYTFDRFPAKWRKYGRAAGPLRNESMVNSGVDICYAFYYGASTGTKDCAGRARRAGIKVVEIFHREEP